MKKIFVNILLLVLVLIVFIGIDFLYNKFKNIETTVSDIIFNVFLGILAWGFIVINRIKKNED